MLGRSDGVLNPGGIRFGPTDIYSVLENEQSTTLGIEETLVVGLLVDRGADEKVILFVKVYHSRSRLAESHIWLTFFPQMRAGVVLDEAIIKYIKTAIRVARSARHVPARILQVSDIPVTLTGKRVEGRLHSAFSDTVSS
jgi:acetoacetyl-CoA synthetase